METIRIDTIHASKTNPRKHFDKKALEELTASVKAHGVLQPVLVRLAMGDGDDALVYELIAGERRWRAAKAAGLKDIPAVVMKLDDKQVLEIQVIENLQRADLHPMEEAEGYEQLMQKHKYTAEQIADKIGKSKGYVYARMKLTALCEPARKAFYEDKLNPSIALLIARIPDEKLQEQALEEILEGDPYGSGDDPMSYRAALQHIQDTYMLLLAEAPFDTKSATLLPAMGPCTTCPFRTGNQKELFPDIKSADVCTKPTCFQKKKEESWKLVEAIAKQAGHRIMSKSETQQVLRYGSLNSDAPYVELNDSCQLDPKRRSWKQLIGSQKPPMVLAKDNNDRVRELVRKDDANRALQSAGHKFHVVVSRADDPKKRAEDQKKQEEKQELLTQLIHTLIARTASCIRDLKSPLDNPDVVRLLVAGVVDRSCPESEWLKSQGLKQSDCRPSELLKIKAGVPLEKWVSRAVELALNDFANDWYQGGVPKIVETAAEMFGIDPKEVEAELHEKMHMANEKAKAKK